MLRYGQGKSHVRFGGGALRGNPRDSSVPKVYAWLPADRAASVCDKKRKARRELSEAVWISIKEQTKPWVEDILYSVFDVDDDLSRWGEVAPTVSPKELGDKDSRFAKLPCGITIHYKEWFDATSSKRDAPLILLMHGYNGSEFSFRAIGPALAKATGFHVIAFDRPPFGLSSRPLEWGTNLSTNLDFNPYDLPGSTRIVEQFIDYLGKPDKDIMLVGHSAGAIIALELLKNRASQIKSLTLIAPAVPSTPEHSFQRRLSFGQQLRFLVNRAILSSDKSGIRFVRRQLLKQKLKVAEGELGFIPHAATSPGSSHLNFTLEHTFSDTNGSSSASMDHAIQGYLRPLLADDWDNGALLNMRSMSLMQEFDYNKVLAPICIIAGKDDTYITDNARALVNVLQDRQQSSLVKYHELACGHVPMEEAPFEVTKALIEFISDTCERK